MSKSHNPEYKGRNFETVEEERQFFRVEIRRQIRLARSYRNAMYTVRNLLLPHVTLPNNWHLDHSPDMLAMGSPIQRARDAVEAAKGRSHNIEQIRVDIRSPLLERLTNWLIDFNRSK